MKASATTDSSDRAAADSSDSPTGAPRATRCGRPPREFAGEVERRILDAATDVFLDRGLEGATIDEIAERARAGKPTIYARFANKEAVFRAVVARKLAEDSQDAVFDAPGATAEERLRTLAAALVERSVAPDRIHFMRSLAAEARRFPELATDVLRMFRDRNAQLIPPLLRELAQTDASAALPDFTAEAAEETTRRFIELAVLPMTIRALFGEDVLERRDEIDAHVAEAVAFFLAGVRGGA